MPDSDDALWYEWHKDLCYVTEDTDQLLDEWDAVFALPVREGVVESESDPVEELCVSGHVACDKND